MNDSYWKTMHTEMMDIGLTVHVILHLAWILNFSF
jgi:hypothetical protein